MFTVVNVFSTQQETTAATFDTEADADRYIAIYGGNGGGTWPGPVWARVARPATWREAMARKLENGVWVKPVWSGEDFWTNGEAARVDHFAHVAIDDPTMIAFTPDAAKGEADRQTRMKPGRYLNKFFPDLGAKKIAFMAEWWTKGQRPPVDCEGSMALATTGDEIEAAYDSGVDSCMRGSDCVRVYAAGDLAVAHWVRDGETVARALVWPEKAVYGRVYPDPDHETEGHEWAFGTALMQAMEAKGWTATRVSANGFNGARIAKVERDYDEGYVMPYMDQGYGVDDHGSHFVMSDHPTYGCDSTEGYICAGPEYDYSCDQCDEGTDEVYNVVTRFREGRVWHTEVWCESCESHSSFRCEGLDRQVSDSLSSVEVDGCTTMALDHAEREVSLGNLWVTEDGEYVSVEPAAADDSDDTLTTTVSPAAAAMFALGDALGTVAPHAVASALCPTPADLPTYEAA